MKRYFDFDMNDYKDKKCNFHSHTVRCRRTRTIVWSSVRWRWEESMVG